MFLKRKKSQRFGASSFSKCHYTRRKISLPPLGLSYTELKNHTAIGRNSERCSYHTDLSRFVLYISEPSALNFAQFVGFQNSPNLRKIEKVAETCEFDGKEPLFVERTIAISIRVLGWSWKLNDLVTTNWGVTKSANVRYKTSLLDLWTHIKQPVQTCEHTLITCSRGKMTRRTLFVRDRQRGFVLCGTNLCGASARPTDELSLARGGRSWQRLSGLLLEEGRTNQFSLFQLIAAFCSVTEKIWVTPWLIYLGPVWSGCTVMDHNSWSWCALNVIRVQFCNEFTPESSIYTWFEKENRWFNRKRMVHLIKIFSFYNPNNQIRSKCDRWVFDCACWSSLYWQTNAPQPKLVAKLTL